MTYEEIKKNMPEEYEYVDSVFAFNSEKILMD